MVRLVLALLAAAPLVAFAQDARGAPPAVDAAPAAAAATPPAPLREGVYLGVGLGTSALFSPDEALRAFRIRLGMTRSPRLQFGLEIQHAESDAAELDFTDASATFFPWERIFFARGGFGFSSLARAQNYYFPGVSTPVRGTSGGSGINVLAGIGAQLGRADGVCFTVNLEGQAHWIRDLVSNDHRTEATLSAWLGLEWH